MPEGKRVSTMKSETLRKPIALFYGILCHSLFVVAVGVMIYEMYFGMSRSWGALRSPWNWISNAALLLQFPIVHSLLLSRAGRFVLNRLAPRNFASALSTTNYVIIASIQTFLLFGFWSSSGAIWWQARGALFPVMVLLYASGWLLLVKSMFDAGITLQTGSLGWWSVLRNKPPAYPGLRTGGLFRIIRQPIYASFAITLWTVPTWTPDQLFLASGLTVYCLIGPLFKEARFRRLFGREFEDYRVRHPYWFPWPRPARLENASERNPKTGRIFYL